ncbi:Abi family protein [Olegusella massiliensis]|uniref:Abi family protein n=1 Tax=Olegusella massiliensis TaxID=1776381 RepID=UPI000839A7B8|nr:Abi family protein [Olegusella massiliensis]
MTKHKMRWHGKPGPTLDPKDQISYLASRGITFERVDQNTATRYLRDTGGFMRTASYKSLFPKLRHTDGSSSYIGLDFAELMDLTEIDHELRFCFLPLVLDVEHSAKLQLLYLANKKHEDPYEIVEAYISSLSSGKRQRLMAELENRRGDNDIYSGFLIDKYVEDMPLWVIAEVFDFGDFLDLWGFCARRWHSEELVQVRYLLKDTKDLRNACAHGSCILNGIASGYAPYETPLPLIQALKNAHIASDQQIMRWTSNPRTLELLAALWCFNKLVRDEQRRAYAHTSLDKFFARARKHADWYTDNETLVSCYRFFMLIAKAWR